MDKFWKRWIALFYGNYIWENNYDYIGTLWFLVALFCTEIIFGLILRYINNRKIQIITVGLIGCVGFVVAFMESQFEFRLPWCLDIALVSCIFYGCGYFWKEYTVNKQISTILGGVFIIVGVAFGVLNYFYMVENNYEIVRPDMFYLNFGMIPLYLLTGILCSLGGIILCRNFKYVEKFRIINHLGRMSLIIMVLHLYVLNLLNRIGEKIGITNPYVILLATLIISYFLGYIIERYCTPIYKMPKGKKK